MEEKQVNLKVEEAVQDDVDKGIVRIDHSFMQEIGIKSGDIVEIKGQRTTVAIAGRAYPGDVGRKVIRIDGTQRRNAKTGVGEVVRVKKIKVDEAKKITIAPARKGVVIRASSSMFKQGLLGRAVIKGDIVSLGGTRTRKTAMSRSPFFDDIFPMLDETFSGFGLGGLRFVVAETNPKNAVVITDATEVVLNPEAVEVKEETIPDITYEDIGGLKEEIKKIREMVELPLKHPEIFETLGIEAPKGVLLHGPPGTGKTLLAKAVANETNSHFILINGPEVMSKYYGQSEENLRKKFEEAQKNSPCIIFFDEIDALAPKREDVKGEVERRVVAQLLANMDGLQSRGKVVVIAATNIPNMIDPALRRPGRFDREIIIGVPDKIGRLNVLKIHTRNMPLDKDVKLNKLAEVTHGFVGADLAALAKEAAMIVLRRVLPKIKLGENDSIPKEILEKLKIHMKDFKEALKFVRPSAMREVLVEIPNVSWKDVGGMEGVKQELIEAVEWPLKHNKSFDDLGIKPPKGILIYGAPGTGKTLLAKAVANESKANFISVKGQELQVEGIVGRETERLRRIFKKARQAAPCIIFFDEIDGFAKRRTLGGGSFSDSNESLVNTLLTEMDGLQDLNEVIIIGATNRPDILDTALLRPGRFDRIILTPVPDDESRLKIFEIHTFGMKLAKDVNIKKLAKESKYYTGADIESICREAGIFALREDIKAKEIKAKHFELAIDKVKASATKDIEEAYKDLENFFRSSKGKQMKDERPSYMG
tara:strand:- start:2640 stop:4928 length:2289 start_codon:yes stop_codon:yes gene_type:complete